MNPFFENSIAKIFYDEALDTLFLEYLSKVPGDESFIEINSALLKAFCTLKTQKFVADIRKMGMISVNSQKWVIENLLPGMMKHLNGKMLYHAQMLDPKDILSKVSGTNIRSKSKDIAQGFEVLQFSERKDLEDYLRSR